MFFKPLVESGLFEEHPPPYLDTGEVEPIQGCTAYF
jgi:hypothetical protein